MKDADLLVVLRMAGSLPISTRAMQDLTYSVLAPSWERQRARRVNRLLTADLLPFINAEPYRRPILAQGQFASVTDLEWPPGAPRVRIPAIELVKMQVNTPLLRVLSPSLDVV